MPIEDFLITFRADTAGALASINQLASRVQVVDAQLNAAMARLQTGGNVSPLQNLAQGSTQAVQGFNAVSNASSQLGRRLQQVELNAKVAGQSLTQLRIERDRLEAQLPQIRGTNVGAGGIQEAQVVERLLNVQRAISALDPAEQRAAAGIKVMEGQMARLSPTLDASNVKLLESVRNLRSLQESSLQFGQRGLSPARLLEGFNQSLDLSRRGFSEGAQSAQFFAQQIDNLPNVYDRATEAFGHHARRIAEGIILYDAFGRVVQSVSDEIRNITDVARERIRFEAVLGTQFGEGQNQEFISQLGDIAVRTNTQMGDLASVLDTVAASMRDAGDASTAQADAMKFLNDVGQFTNITQRDVATETDNLIGLFNLSGDTIDQFGNRLGRIVVAGHNSSSVIAEISDALNEAGRSAHEAGFDFDILTAIAADIVPKFKGAISGRELGAAINTFIGRLRDPKVVQDIEDISKGLIHVRDAATGALRPASDVFLDIAKAKDQLDPATFERIVDAIVPPLNPGQRSTINTIINEFIPALKAAGPQMAATADDARTLSDALVAGPAETVSRAFIALGAAATQAFSDDIVRGAGAFAGFLSILTDLIKGLDNPVGQLAIQLLTLGAGLRLISFVGGSVIKFLFAGQIKSAALAAELARAGIISAEASGQLTLWNASLTGTTVTAGAATGALRTLTATVFGLLRAFAPLLAVYAAFQVADFIHSVNEQTKALNAQTASLLVNADAFDTTIAKLKELQDAQAGGGPINELAKIAFVNPSLEAQRKNIEAAQSLSDLQGKSVDDAKKRLADLQAEMDKFNPFLLGIGGPENSGQLSRTIDVLKGIIAASSDGTIDLGDFQQALGGAAMAADDASDSQKKYQEFLDALNRPLTEVTNGVNGLTDAEQRQAAATEINNGLSGVRARLLNEYLDQLDKGKITLDEFNAAQENIGRSSDLASRFIAAFGSDLSLLPEVQRRVKETGVDAATAITQWAAHLNPTTASQILDVIDQMIKLKEADLEAAQNVAANPIMPTVETAPLQTQTGKATGILNELVGGTLDTAKFLQANKPRPELDLSALRQQLREALSALQVLRSVMGTNKSPFGALPDFFQKPVESALSSGITDKIKDLRAAIRKLEGTTHDGSNAELDALRRQIQILEGIKEGDSRLNDTLKSQKPQTSLVDVGDLSGRQIERAIAIARRLQNKIPGANKEAADETVALIRDARFLQFIRGLDQRFLAEAIQALTDVEKKRLELEQQRLQDVTRSVVVRSGPIQSIVSAPVLAAGGGLLSGSGLNADPRLGNITINVPINWSGMSLTQLQQFIYKAISQAWIDAGRGG